MLCVFEDNQIIIDKCCPDRHMWIYANVCTYSILIFDMLFSGDPNWLANFNSKLRPLILMGLGSDTQATRLLGVWFVAKKLAQSCVTWEYFPCIVVAVFSPLVQVLTQHFGIRPFSHLHEAAGMLLGEDGRSKVEFLANLEGQIFTWNSHNIS